MWGNPLARDMDLLRLYMNGKYSLSSEISPWLWVPLGLLLVAVSTWLVARCLRSKELGRFGMVSVDIQLGGVGKVQMKPNVEDIRIAHQIWAELITRKAALPIDPEHDVIIEVYDSWYALFQRIRELVCAIPGECVRKQESTRALVRIATDTLNLGLRPHLTQWQARFRNWYAQQEDELRAKHPQEVQRGFPEYASLVKDMQNVNDQLIQYAYELARIVRGG